MFGYKADAKSDRITPYTEENEYHEFEGEQRSNLLSIAFICSLIRQVVAFIDVSGGSAQSTEFALSAVSEDTSHDDRSEEDASKTAVANESNNSRPEIPHTKDSYD